MLQFNRWQTILIIGSVVFGALFSAPNFFSDEQLENYPGFLPKGQVNLGLDLQGGSYLLLGVDSDKVIEDRLRGLRTEIQRQMRPDRRTDRSRIVIAGGRISFDEETGLISFRVQDAAQVEDAVKRARGCDPSRDQWRAWYWLTALSGNRNRRPRNGWK